MEIWFEFHTWIALLTLTLLEIVLGIDNIIFIAIICNRLPKNQQGKARTIGLSLALILRILLLIGIAYIVQMKEPLFTILSHGVSLRDILLFLGGLFLLAKSVSEIHSKMDPDEKSKKIKTHSLSSVIFQIILFDLIFSLDSVLTAVGMVQEISVMITAVVIAIVIMLIFSKRISDFINNNPTLQILALSFLTLIGVMLIMEAAHYEIPKGYIYFAVFFSLLVELINMRLRKKTV